VGVKAVLFTIWQGLVPSDEATGLPVALIWQLTVVETNEPVPAIAPPAGALVCQVIRPDVTTAPVRSRTVPVYCVMVGGGVCAQIGRAIIVTAIQTSLRISSPVSDTM
jgi:hypothetical protein